MRTRNKQNGKIRHRQILAFQYARKRLRTFGMQNLFLWFCWALLLVALLHRIFLSFFGDSIFAQAVEYVQQSTPLRVLAVIFCLVAFFDLARSIGAASVAQPFERFARHLDSVDGGEGKMFQPRKGDRAFLPIVKSYNRMNARLRRSRNSRQEERARLLSIIDKYGNVPEGDCRSWLEELKKRNRNTNENKE